jgi:hypothetical protein
MTQNNNQTLINQKEIETVKIRFGELKTETRNEYDITKTDGTNIKGVKTLTETRRILEFEGKVDEVLKKLDSLGKTPTLQPMQKELGENPETKTPEIIQEPQIDKEKVEVLKEVESNLTNNNDTSGSEGSE